MIGTNKKDAQDTVDSDLRGPRGREDPGRPAWPATASATEALLAERKPDHVTFEGWQAIDAAEVAAGEPHGRPRVKFCRVDEMVEASKAKTAA